MVTALIDLCSARFDRIDQNRTTLDMKCSTRVLARTPRPQRYLITVTGTAEPGLSNDPLPSVPDDPAPQQLTPPDMRRAQ